MIIIFFLIFIVSNIFTIYFFLENRKLREIQIEQRAEKERLEERLKHSDDLKNKLEEEVANLRNLENTAKLEVSRLEERLKHLQEQYEGACKEKEQISDTLKNEFQEIMHRLLRERSERLEESNSKTLAPLREELKLFKEQVEKSYIHEREQRTSLQNEIKGLMERSQELSKEAQQLAVALKGDSKVQGDWGEMILERILEQSGLEENCNYYIQNVIEGVRPDVVIKYPDKRFVVIDSKVSLTAYTDYVNAETKTEQTKALDRHLDSIKKHIDELSSKKYNELFVQFGNSLDFVLMFIPNEPAYQLAIHKRPKFWDYAYQKKILLVNPSGLMAILRMTMDIWQRDKQIQNVNDVIYRASLLYRKFDSFESNFSKLETSFNKASEMLQKTKGQLFTENGNLKRQVEMLKDSGGGNSKILNSDLKKSDMLE